MFEKYQIQFQNWLKARELPSLATVEEKLGKIDGMLIPFYAIFMAWMTYVIGTAYQRFGPTSVESMATQEQLFSGFTRLAIVIGVLAFFESLRRNELLDFAKVVAGIAISFVAMQLSSDWVIVALAYGLGFVLAHEASRSGKLDWTPLIAFNGAFIGLATHTFGFAASTVIWPVLVSVLVEVVEIVRNRDYQAVRLALPGLVLVVFGLVVSTAPVNWILIGAVVSFVVVPTAFRIYREQIEGNEVWIQSCDAPFNWGNGLDSVRISFEAAMFTLVVAAMATLTSLMI